MIKLKKYKLLDFMIMMLIVLYLTELFRFALFLHISLDIFAVLAVALLSVYAILHYHILARLIKTKKVFLYALLIFVFMLITIPIYFSLGFLSLAKVVRPLGNSLLYLLLFFAAYIIGLKYDFKHLNRFIIYPSVIIIIAGLVYNYINPNLFYKLRLLLNDADGDADSDSLSKIERAAGFYLKSTYAAFSMVPVFFFLFVSKQNKKILTVLLITVIIVGLVFLTGSRSVLLFLVPASFFISKLVYKTLSKKYRLAKNASAELVVIGMPLIMITAFASLFYISIYLSDQGYKVLGNRVVSLTSADDLSSDNSVNERLEAQKLYLGKIVESPLFGYGPLYTTDLKKSGQFTSNSHNSYIEYTFRYGIVYILIFLAFNRLLWKSFERKLLSNYYNFDYLGFFVVYLLVCSLFNNTMMENKTIVIMLGIGIAMGKRIANGLPPEEVRAIINVK
ncbi:O-antigen ligase family protein [Mucilaginibacter sp. 14171R-50]|uniref:O-antigen ligase family protein n=1 Tax=Mucilaginibacter sp. 14171R-50 TaxID=2703789 RepID=UPI00138BC6FE|nr:O-antigen ligase family protein [Mucilaginibacter sp. 14171R-50]QHS54273.1 O-antigen ligase family protein [Mucilaginibacter sp. 14171R-50]